MDDNKDLRNTDIEEELESAIVELTDEEGNVMQFELVDEISYNNEDYAVLLPPADAEDADNVYIFRLLNTEDEEMQEYEIVEDENILEAVFGIFKEKFADEFDFE